MSVRYYLGVDGGGTSTRALAATSDGQVLGSGHAGSANRNHYTRDEARWNIRCALMEALRGRAIPPEQVTIFLGMSGVSTDRDRQEIESIVREIPEIGAEARVAVENDTVAGLTGGLAGEPGAALIAGTGSACLGINRHGERWFCGGWGALADDAGSAPWVGLRALQAAVRAEDGRGEPTALKDAVFQFLELTEPRNLLGRIHNHPLDRAMLGELAPIVIETYQNGDATAAAILNQAAAELSGLAAATAEKLFGSSPCALILVGGLALSGPPFQDMLTARLLRDTPSLSLQEPILSPVQGAVLEALRLDGSVWTPSLIARLAESGASPLAYPA